MKCCCIFCGNMYCSAF